MLKNYTYINIQLGFKEAMQCKSYKVIYKKFLLCVSAHEGCNFRCVHTAPPSHANNSTHSASLDDNNERWTLQLPSHANNSTHSSSLDDNN